MSILEFKRKTDGFNQTSRLRNTPIPPVGMDAIGIDLGTTNSVISIFNIGLSHPETLQYGEEKNNLIPSMIFYDAKTNKNIVGHKAKEYLKKEPHEVIRSIKRSMGKLKSEFTSYGKTYRAEDVAAILLEYIVLHPKLQEIKMKYGGLWAVITVPAHFDDASRMATLAAAEKVGIYVLRIINEPTSAALAYSMIASQENNFDKETIAVFDLGGGTFDVSIVDRQQLTFNVLSSEGDIHLGGDDIDAIIADYLKEKVQPKLVSMRMNKESESYRKLLVYAESMKKQFISEGTVEINDTNLDGHGSSLFVKLDRDEFERMITSIIERTIYLTESAMHAAKRSPKKVSRILLVGGSTRLSLVKRLLGSYFPCQVDERLEPDLAVSWGAALQAAIILGIQPDTILVDVCSHTLGVGVVEDPSEMENHYKTAAKKLGLSYPFYSFIGQEMEKHLKDKMIQFNEEVQKNLSVAPILHRNSSLPAKRSEFFNTLNDNQYAIQVIIVQGEELTVGENRLIGTFLFQLEHPCPKGTRCEIQLTYDSNGMVQVFAKQLGTLNTAKAIFDSRTGEVSGWAQEKEIPVSDEDFLIPKVPSIKDKKSTKKNTFSLELVKKENTSTNNENALIINAVVLRARRILAKMDLQSENYFVLENTINTYVTLLKAAQEGSENDHEIESIEERLFSLIEGK